MAAKKIALASIRIPDFGLPRSQPLVNPAEYEQRIELARARARDAGLDFLLVYGDREHFANLAYLTDHDPRFEEALLVLTSAGGQPILIVGNEGLTYSELIPIELERRLCQGFSLLGQKRDTNPRLEPVLRDCGLQRGSRVGLAGWKSATSAESDDPEHWLDTPAFIVDALRTLTGDPKLVTNATALFADPVEGLRVINSVDQLAAFEFAATHCSQMGRQIIEHLQPGLTELEAVQNAGWNGLPLSCHLMFSSGPRARLGLPSPVQRIIQRGDPFFMALGLRGSLIARGGFVIADATELPTSSADYLDHLVKPYFAMVAAWYEQVGLGVTGGELQTRVDEAMTGSDFGLALNPGHLIHLDEWLHSPIYPGSEIRLRSGMLLQCDLIPVIEAKYHTTNAEDTIALADPETRAQLADSYPEAWQRIQVRRAFMQDVLGIRLKPEVLPFSNLPAVLQPFALSPNLAMVAGA